jgi:hypothetical protein
LEHAEVELSNNVAENSMRPVTFGEKELAARGQREVGPQGSGDTLGGGILPPNRRTGETISAGRAAGNESKEAIGSGCAHPSPMEVCSRLTCVGRTITVGWLMAGRELVLSYPNL